MTLYGATQYVLAGATSGTGNLVFAHRGRPLGRCSDFELRVRRLLGSPIPVRVQGEHQRHDAHAPPDGDEKHAEALRRGPRRRRTRRRGQRLSRGLTCTADRHQRNVCDQHLSRCQAPATKGGGLQGRGEVVAVAGYVGGRDLPRHEENAHNVTGLWCTLGPPANCAWH